MAVQFQVACDQCNTRRRGFAAILAVPSCLIFLAIVLHACSGGSLGTEYNRGSVVAILFGVTPDTRFTRAEATIGRIELNDSAGRRVALLEGERTVDLLAVQDGAELLGLAKAVPPGPYDTVRIQLTDLSLIPKRESAAGGPMIEPRLPRDGYIVIKPRRRPEVAAGDVTILQIDLDLGKSVQQGDRNHDHDGFQFRPLFLVHRLSSAYRGRLVRFQGRITEINRSAVKGAVTSLGVCGHNPSTRDPDRDGDVNAGVTSAANGAVTAARQRGNPTRNEEGAPACVSVGLTPDAELFDVAGPVAVDRLAGGQLVGVTGRITTDRHGRGVRLEAAMIEFGPREAYSRLSGTIANVSATDVFDLDPDGGGPRIAVQLRDGAKILSAEGFLQRGGDVVAGDRVRLVGSMDTGDPALLRAHAAVIAKTADDSGMRVSGTIRDFDGATGTFTVTSAAGVVGIRLEADAQILVLSVGDDGHVNEAVDLASLRAGQHVEVYGHADFLGGVEAEQVITTPTIVSSL